jgi:aconitate hydratase
MAFVGSPELVTAMAIAGDLGFNLTDTLINEDEEVMLDAPTGDELPKNGFDAEDKGFQEPAADGRGVEVTVSETSDRLQLLVRLPHGTEKTLLVLIAYQSIWEMYH